MQSHAFPFFHLLIDPLFCYKFSKWDRNQLTAIADAASPARSLGSLRL